MTETINDRVIVRSFAEGGVGPRFGINSERMTNGRCPLHRHDYFEVMLCFSTAAAQRVSIHEYSARRGSIFFISPMVAHQLRFDSTQSCYVLYFDLAFLRPDIPDPPTNIDFALLKRVPQLAPFVYQEHIDFLLSESDIAVLKPLCDRMLAERTSPRLCSEEVIRSTLALLLAEVTQRYEEKIRGLMHERPPGGGSERHVKGVIRFISDNLDRKISLSDAADRVAVSPNYLASLLKRELGRTFVQLVTEKRMDRARELLSFTDTHISKIAYSSGFEDPNYFCKRFKQLYGCTPLEFRATHAVAPVRQFPGVNAQR
ncbi:MAG: helix-turn-helix domain-containing protein [Hyphomicrobiales bacterium]|nr:helix-turn-helix domain-containing protein [Hyphomicrobiales bacterium]